MSISLGQAHSSPRGWRKLLDRIGAAARDGLPMRAQVAPRPIGTLYGLQSSLNPFSVHPAFREIQSATLAEKVSAFRDPSFRARLKSEGPAEHHAKLVKRLNDFARIFPLGATPDYEPPRECSLASMAEAQGRDVIDVACDLLVADEGHAFLFAPFSNYAEFSLDACGEMMEDPHTVMGLGDGGAHVGLISDGSFPTYLLTHWGRDRSHGRFALERLVKKQTSDTARAVGLFDRGVIAAGYKADINIIDFDRLKLEAPVMAFDLPAGGKRLLQRVTGYEATIVSGAVTYRNGEATDALPGRLVRGSQAAPK